MSECRSTISIMEHANTRRMSLHQCAEEEALQFKWIESQKAGHDLGETAIRAWIGQHWRGFLRHRWLEHLQGKTFWIELEQQDFGLVPVVPVLPVDRCDYRSPQARQRESRHHPVGAQAPDPHG